MVSHEKGEQTAQPVEIERKFLLKYVPEAVYQMPPDAIRQGYMVIGADGSEARLRDTNGLYTITVKSKGELVRGEWETPITVDQFEKLWPTTDGRRIEKNRYSIPHNGATIEVDVYQGTLANLMVAEIEFKDPETAGTFEKPEWLGDEVTYDRAYKNQQLAVNGWPQEIL